MHAHQSFILHVLCIELKTVECICVGVHIEDLGYLRKGRGVGVHIEDLGYLREGRGVGVHIEGLGYLREGICILRSGEGCWCDWHEGVGGTLMLECGYFY